MTGARRRKRAVKAKTRSRKLTKARARKTKKVVAKRRLKKKPLRVPRKKAARVQRRRKPAAIGSPSVGAQIDSLDLVDYVADAARSLLKAHPGVVFTSGRRNVEQQASAMAGNVRKNRSWIVQTYKASPERAALQAWIDAHPEAVTKAAIAAGLAEIMSGWSDAQKGGFSRHFSGQAFDVKPVANGQAITAAIKALPNLRKFLDKEGGLVIWHADFEKPGSV